MSEVLVACSHGTDDARGRSAVATIVADVARLAPEIDVREAFVDVQSPSLVEVAAATTPAEDVVIVPLLLSAGFHTYVDIAEAAESSGAAAAGTLGPDPRLVDIVVERLHEAGARPDDVIVLAAAGSSDARAITAVESMLTAVRERWGTDVTVAYGGVEPRVPDVVAQLRAGAPDGARVVLASYLLAPGFFLDRLHEAGADVVTAPLAPDPRLAEIVLDRYRAARDAAGARTS
ncbi:hypothetical protein GCM10011331_05380 [Flavimobilis marinus]|uniref:Sirohydrochlorin ferrochelatase n=1 Tax=Flavimobilis marinus TaxID=285351 RepID=A0A1I2D8Y3_9MICO|nr:CbiX/SirB N-terminal domain-containing protein [Flavimobilis marinus]GHG45752.1 hypothetical protein GCM10011331_05380 [Flavimobilis marinus]SFE76985.1 Sirohydrochlorin ferrochelatase [Flavimobilis marinus]